MESTCILAPGIAPPPRPGCKHLENLDIELPRPLATASHTAPDRGACIIENLDVKLAGCKHLKYLGVKIPLRGGKPPLPFILSPAQTEGWGWAHFPGPPER